MNWGHRDLQMRKTTTTTPGLSARPAQGSRLAQAIESARSRAPCVTDHADDGRDDDQRQWQHKHQHDIVRRFPQKTRTRVSVSGPQLVAVACQEEETEEEEENTPVSIRGATREIGRARANSLGHLA